MYGLCCELVSFCSRISAVNPRPGILVSTYASYGSDDNRKFPVVLYQDVFMFSMVLSVRNTHVPNLWALIWDCRLHPTTPFIQD